MKIIALTTLSLILGATAFAELFHVEVTARYVGFDRSKYGEMAGTSSDKKYGDILSALHVTCKSGQRAIIEVVRAAPIPETPAGGKTVDVGFTLDVLPIVKDGKITLSGTCVVRRRLGQDAIQPLGALSFAIHETFFGGAVQDGRELTIAAGDGPEDKARIILTARLVDLTPYEGLPPADMLVAAARAGDVLVLEELLSHGLDVNSVAGAKGGQTALTAAVAANQIEAVRLLLAGGADFELKPEKGDPLVVVFLKKGWLEYANYVVRKGAVCAPELRAAAKGDAAAIKKHLATSDPDSGKLKALCEIAAANGHAAIFATLHDAVLAVPGQPYWTPGGGTLVAAVTHGHRAAIEEMIKVDPNLVKGGVNGLAAAATKTDGMAAWLRAKGFDVPEYNDGERLIDAAERENLPGIRRLLKAGTDVNYRGESDWTPIAKAATWGCPKAVKLLLENHADANTRKHHYTPLSLAKTPEIADLLFAAGAEINAKLSGSEAHIISYCVAHGSKEMVQWFLDHGVDPAKVKGDDSDPTLLFEARTGEIAELLIARGVNVNAKNKFGATALRWALDMKPNPAGLVAVLLKHGADPNERSEGGYTPLMNAPDGATVDALVAAGADLHAKDDRGNGVVAGGAHSSDPTRLGALFRHGLKLDAASGATQLNNAILLRHDLAGVKRLLAMGVDPNIADRWEGRPTGSPLSAAISNGHFKIAEVLRAAGAKDVGLLSEAAARGEIGKMKELLAAGANADERSGNGMTPLHYAVHQGRSAAVQLLLEHGASVNLFDTMGNTAGTIASLLLSQVEDEYRSQLRDLELPAARKTRDEIVAAIRARKPDANYRDEAGETALMCAAQVGSDFPLLISPEENGAVNAQRPDGMTALMLAIVTQPKDAPRDGPGSVGIPNDKGELVQRFSARADVVKTLLEKGADLTLRNKAGQTAFDLARENGNKEILALIEKALEKR